MMTDALRAAKVLPGFRNAADVASRRDQPGAAEAPAADASTASTCHVTWHETLDDVPDGPLIILANEFFDALPVHQAVRHGRRLARARDRDRRRRRTRFRRRRASRSRMFERILAAADQRRRRIGAMFEWRTDTCGARDRPPARTRRRRRADHRLRSRQSATRRHAAGRARAHLFRSAGRRPGLADLTAHVDFQALAAAADSIGARVHGPVEQGEFLRRLGIERRADAAQGRCAPIASEEIDAACRPPDRRGHGRHGRDCSRCSGLSHPKPQALPGFD